MTTATTACWADPLTRKERAGLARKLAHASKRFWDAAEPGACSAAARRNLRESGDLWLALRRASAEMSDLHLDVTERAEVPAS